VKIKYDKQTRCVKINGELLHPLLYQGGFGSIAFHFGVATASKKRQSTYKHKASEVTVP
jgi:hypothetical protein